MQNKGLAIVGILFLLFVVAILYTPTPADKRFTYSKDDKIQHGSYILFEELNEIFQNADVTVSDSTIVNTLKKWDKPNSAYLIITDHLTIFDSLTTTVLDSFINKGNQVFISSTSVSLTELVGNGSVYTQRLNNWDYTDDFPLFNNSTDSVLYNLNQIDVSKDYQTIKMNSLYGKNAYDIDSLNYTQLGKINDSLSNFIQIPHGQGNYYLHAASGIFTNKNMLIDSVANHSAAVLSHLNNVDHIIWDEYYKPDSSFLGKSQTAKKPLLYIFKEHYPLKIAYRLVILGAILLLFTRFKRDQQAIPILPPPTNRTVEFTQNMGNLYFEKGDHYSLATKMLNYFEFETRNEFKTQPFNFYQKKIDELAALTGYQIEDLNEFYKRRKLLTQVTAFTEEQLTSLSNSIEQLKKNRN